MKRKEVCFFAGNSFPFQKALNLQILPNERNHLGLHQGYFCSSNVFLHLCDMFLHDVYQFSEMKIGFVVAK